MAKKKKNNFKINQKYLISGFIEAIIAFILPKYNLLRILLIIIAIILIMISLTKENKRIHKDFKIKALLLCGLFLLFIILDAINVVTFKKIPIFSYNITNTEQTRVYNALGYRVWQCDKKDYKNLKVDPFYQKGYSCDSVDIEEIDSNSFLNSVIENYNLYKNNYLKIKGKISKKNAQNYIEMQPYETTDITVNGYVTFADNITLKILFNNNDASLDKYDVYDEITVVGIIKNMETQDNKYIIYMYDAKIVSDVGEENYDISFTKENECSDQNILYQSDNYNIYTYCLKDVFVTSGEKKYELPMALSSNKVSIDSLLDDYQNKDDDLDGNNLYKFTNYNIVKCNPNNSKDIIIGPAQMTLEDITCSKEENSQ